MTSIVQQLERAPITESFIAKLVELGFPVGDGKIPTGVNWVGQPNLPTATFKPYLVVSEIVASHSSGPLGDSQADWQLPYLVESFGISREVCSKLADRMRAQAKEMRAITWTVGSDEYGVQFVRIDSLGEPQRVAAVSPPVWHTQDGITLWIGKGAS